ncbi:hypothetical protein QR680_008871 [Steinernema hermaphroditum]|uniref:Uncharacterized protein n=1 Tax=Steinernema hermaphroditum TaxID=289476 RepID=A0AA39II77_9BILA|nr:hypothetical protein QR680_008871 [Steinernema hermaphroditum]
MSSDHPVRKTSGPGGRRQTSLRVSHYPVLLLTKNSDEDHHPVEGRVAACWTPCDVPENCVGGSSWLIGGGPLSNGESFGAPHPIRSSESHNDMAENGTLKSNLSRGQLSSRNSGVTWAQSTNLGTDNDPPHGMHSQPKVSLTCPGSGGSGGVATANCNGTGQYSPGRGYLSSSSTSSSARKNRQKLWSLSPAAFHQSFDDRLRVSTGSSLSNSCGNLDEQLRNHYKRRSAFSSAAVTRGGFAGGYGSGHSSAAGVAEGDSKGDQVQQLLFAPKHSTSSLLALDSPPRNLTLFTFPTGAFVFPIEFPRITYLPGSLIHRSFVIGTKPKVTMSSRKRATVTIMMTDVLGQKQQLLSADDLSGFSSGTRPPALGGRSPQSSFDSNGDVGQISVNWMRVNGTIAPFKALLTSTTSNADKQTPPVQKASVTSTALIRAGSVKRANHVPHPIICEITKRKESSASCRITDIVTPRVECGDGESFPSVQHDHVAL